MLSILGSDMGGKAVSSTYYLAPDDAKAVSFVRSGADLRATDHVHAHDMITVPHLTSLADLAEGNPVGIDLSVITHLWPPMPEDPESDQSWMAEPVIERIVDPLRDRIAAIDLERVAALAEAWSGEVSGSVDSGACPGLALELIELTRRGRDHRLTLYNRFEV